MLTDPQIYLDFDNKKLPPTPKGNHNNFFGATPFQSRKEMEIAFQTGYGAYQLKNGLFESVYMIFYRGKWHFDACYDGNWGYSDYDTWQEMITANEEELIEWHGQEWWLHFGWGSGEQ